MGFKFIDQFSYLHFSVGIIAYFWGINLKIAIIVHTIFEISEKASLNPSKEIPIFSSWLEEKSKDGFIQVPANPVFTKTIPINRAITAADKASFSSSN